MEVILLERVAKLGQMGETVRVKDGFARNFLLPRGKALRATEGNKKKFEGQRHQLEARNLELKNEAAVVSEKLDGQSFIIIRQAAELEIDTRRLARALVPLEWWATPYADLHQPTAAQATDGSDGSDQSHGPTVAPSS